MTATIPPEYQGIVDSLVRFLREHPELVTKESNESTIAQSPTECNKEQVTV